MQSFESFLVLREVGPPPPPPPTGGPPSGMPPIPGGIGGPPLPPGGPGLGPPLGGGLGMGMPGQQGQQKPPMVVKTKDVWSLLEKLLSKGDSADNSNRETPSNVGLQT